MLGGGVDEDKGVARYKKGGLTSTGLFKSKANPMLNRISLHPQPTKLALFKLEPLRLVMTQQP